MSQFNLEDYETVKQRKLRFYEDHKDGRIIVVPISVDPAKIAHFKAAIYLTAEDQKYDLPRATGYAYEERDLEKSINRYGKEYESVNYTSWNENCEESAVGRALDNAGYASNARCSREEIEKSQRMVGVAEKRSSVLSNPAKTVSEPSKGLSAHCDYHNTEMTERWSAKKQKSYTAHEHNGELCFGTGTKSEQEAWKKKVATPVDETPIQRDIADTSADDFEKSLM